MATFSSDEVSKHFPPNTEHDMNTHEHIASAAGIFIIGSIWFLVMSL